jgi:hypothetical protein
MKRIFLYFAIILSIGTICSITGCKKTEAIEKSNANFRINIPPSVSDTIFANRLVSFDVEVITGAGLQKVEVRKDFQLIDGTVKTYTDTKTGIYKFTFTAGKFDIGKKFNFVIVAYDSEGSTTTANYSVTVKAAPVFIDIKIPDTAPASTILYQNIAFTAGVTSELPIKSIQVLKNGVEVSSLTKTTFANPLSDQFPFSYTTIDDDAGQTLIFTILVTDSEDKEKTATYSLFVSGERPPRAVQEYTILMGGQNSTDNGQFYSSADGKTSLRAGIAAKSATIDLLSFVSGAATGVNITAPSFANAPIIYTAANSGADAVVSWPVRNVTQLIRLNPAVTAANFAALKMDKEIETLFNNGGATTDNVNKIVANDVIVFKTVKGKHGLMLIKSIPANNAGFITIDVKMQP